MLIDTEQQQFSQLLRYAAEGLDIPDAVDQQLSNSYNDLAAWVRGDNESRYSTDSAIYTQGSRRLGTLTRPVNPEDDYDIDLVYRRDLARSSTTQKDLKKDIGHQLRRYIDDRAAQGNDVPALEEGSRCWTLVYGDYHVDVLPALPDDETYKNNNRNHEDGIIITDREVRNWQPSNPKGYADWFKSRMADALMKGRREMALEAKVDIEEVPERTVKTPLQVVVQLLKRHRDLRFNGRDRDDKPASIIITTLAAQAYANESDVYAALAAVTAKMHRLIENSEGDWWVPNPVNPSENFADRWRRHPHRAQIFFDWIVQVHTDYARAGTQRGMRSVTATLAESVGSSAAEYAATRLGDAIHDSRKSGNLSATAGTATLGATGSLVVPGHTFYGDLHEA